MKFRDDIPVRASQITPEEIFTDRRRVTAALLAGAATIAGTALAQAPTPAAPGAGKAAGAAGGPVYTRNARFTVKEPLTSFDDVTGYNNFYEFGTDKSDPKANAGSLKPRPWTLQVAGEADLTGRFNLEDLLKTQALEERIYRFRCVEAWSMVVPWLGMPLADLLKRFKPNSRAKYVEFTTLLDPKQMPGQRTGVLGWPYMEGLRIDEAMHPLAMMVVGVYGRWLPNQNGAPLRLMVPWKYGFKNIKSIVRIRFTETQPDSTWNVTAPDEYGFYANVNPEVDHPRWSQASERRIGAGLFAGRAPTLPFNGYANEVAGLYRGMDLRRYFLNDRRVPDRHRLLYKPAAFAAALVPLLLLVAGALALGGRTLGADPVARVLDVCGKTTLNLLLLTLAVTPARILTGWSWLLKYRRMLGLFAFFYACLHLLSYLLLDLGLDFGHLGQDILKRPFITIGFLAVLLLVPLAATSTQSMMRRLGRRWQTLHYLIYPIAMLGVWHYYWQVKADVREPLVYVALLALLLGFRLWRRWRAATSRSGSATAPGRT